MRFRHIILGETHLKCGVYRSVVWDVPLRTWRSLRSSTWVISPNLITANTRAEPPTALIWTITLVPIVDEHMRLLALHSCGIDLKRPALLAVERAEGSNAFRKISCMYARLDNYLHHVGDPFESSFDYRCGIHRRWRRQSIIAAMDKCRSGGLVASWFGWWVRIIVSTMCAA